MFAYDRGIRLIDEVEAFADHEIGGGTLYVIRLEASGSPDMFVNINTPSMYVHLKAACMYAPFTMANNCNLANQSTYLGSKTLCCSVLVGQ